MTHSQLRSLLILCEGETEFNYLKAFRSHLRIPSKLVEIRCEGCDPSKLMRVGKRMFKGKRRDGQHDLCVLVFDGKEHAHAKRVRDLCMKKAYSCKFVTCISNPCIEVWFLLHFSVIRKTISADEALSMVTEEIPDYTKTSNVFDKLIQKLPLARDNEKTTREYAEGNSSKLFDYPFSDIPEVLSMIEACKVTQAGPARKPRR